MAGQSAVLSEAPGGINRRVGLQEPVDHQWKHRYVGGAHDLGQGDVDGGVFQRGESTVEHCLGQGAEEVAAACADLGRPLGVIEATGSVALVEGDRKSVV